MFRFTIEMADGPVKPLNGTGLDHRWKRSGWSATPTVLRTEAPCVSVLGEITPGACVLTGSRTRGPAALGWALTLIGTDPPHPRRPRIV